MALKLVPREKWGARPPRHRVSGKLTAESTCHWNGPTIKIKGKTTWDHSICPVLVRGIQNYHMDQKGWSDGAYNFVECPHGYTFEMRGLNIVNGANGTNSGNRSSHAICCLAGEDNPFSEEEKSGFKSAVEYISENTAAPNSAKGHRDHKSTECPGDERYNWVHVGMPTVEVPSEPPYVSTEEEDDMNEPLEIVVGSDGHWFVTDGITKQWVQNRHHAAILCFNRGANAETKPVNMSSSELAKMKPFVWPQDAIDSIRLVGPTPPKMPTT